MVLGVICSGEEVCFHTAAVWLLQVREEQRHDTHGSDTSPVYCRTQIKIMFMNRIKSYSKPLKVNASILISNSRCHPNVSSGEGVSTDGFTFSNTRHVKQ